MTDWVDVAIAKSQAALRRQARAASAPLSVPIRATAPGWHDVGHWYSTVPDVAYPWDPAVYRALLAFVPEMVPITIRSAWQTSWEDGPVQTMVLVRQGLARRVPDPTFPTHLFDCTMRSAPCAGYPRVPRPNLIEVNWYDRDVRPWGRDLPGAYLPFDWFFYRQLRWAFWNGKVQSAAEMKARYVAPSREAKVRAKASRASETADRDKELNRYVNSAKQKVSDVEWKEYFLGGKDAPAEPTPFVDLGGSK